MRTRMDEYDNEPEAAYEARHPDAFDEEYADYYDPENDCPTCRGNGKVTTADYESYLGAMYKPCPTCGGDPCVGEPPLT